MDESLKEAERAILCLYDASSDAGTKQSATSFCEGLKSSSDSWRGACQLLVATKEHQVKFWCLQALIEVVQHKYESLSADDMSQFRQFLVSWLVELYPHMEPQPPFILNKISQLYAILVRHEYPENWDEAITTLLHALNIGQSLVDMFLRILDALDEEIINSEFHRSPADTAVSMKVKDGIRDQCVVQISQAWYTILQNFHETEPKLAKGCLSTMARYISWIDISLVVNDRFLPAFWMFLAMDNFVEEAAGCLTEIVLKKMEPLAKVAMLSAVVSSSQIAEAMSVRESKRHTQALVKLSTLVTAICKELLACGDKIVDKSCAEEVARKELFNAIIPMLLRCTESTENDVSQATMDFVVKFVDSVKKEDELSEHLKGQLVLLMGVLQRKLAYSDDFDFVNEGEEEEIFLEYRKEVFITYKNIVRSAPVLSSTFLCERVVDVMGRISTAGMGEIEIVITMLYELGEVVKIEMEAAAEGSPIRVMGMALLAANPLGHPHPAVQKAAMETINRFTSVLKLQVSSFPAVFSAFLRLIIAGGDPSVRSRACYLLLRVVRSLRGCISVHVEGLITSLTPVLLSDDVIIDQQEKLQLFECAGQLLAAEGVTNEARLQHLTAIVGVLLDGMERSAAVYTERGGGVDDATVWMIANRLETIGWLSKGIWRLTPEQELLFYRGLDVAVRVISLAPPHDRLRSCTLVYLHRMVDCLGRGTFTVMPRTIIEILRKHEGEAKVAMDLLVLVNQMISRFKEDCADVLGEVYTVITTAMLGMVQRGKGLLESEISSQASQEAREFRDMYKVWVQFVHCIVYQGLSSVCVQEMSVASLQPIVSSIIEGLMLVREPASAKTSIQVLSKMTIVWATDRGAARLPGFGEFMLAVAGRVVFEVCVAEWVSSADAQGLALYSEIAALQKIFDQVSVEWCNLLGTQLLPVMGFDQARAEDYVRVMKGGTEREFRNHLITQMKLVRGEG